MERQGEAVRVRLKLNHEDRSFLVSERRTLLQLIREDAGLTGTKKGCDLGECGTCTVILNGRAVNSCCVLAVQADGGDVVTIEGLGTADRLHPVQRAFVELGAIQCGFCTPGMVLSAKALLDREPHPTREAIRAAMSGNLCRCTGYAKIEAAVLRAEELLAEYAERGCLQHGGTA